VVIMCGILCQIAQLYVSIRTREQHLDLTGDPWNGRTLEWATTSPPPPYNFAVLPRVETIDAFWDMKQRGTARPAPAPAYEAIEVPRNSPVGIVIAFFASIAGFTLIWHIWWLAIIALLGAAITLLVFGWLDDREREISAAEMAETERARSGRRQFA
jgi:cytochrome o ubiquinol oxidase subunit 1